MLLGVVRKEMGGWVQSVVGVVWCGVVWCDMIRWVRLGRGRVGWQMGCVGMVADWVGADGDEWGW